MYKCGHKHSRMEKEYQKDKQKFILWKYTVGSDGDKSLCMNCWKEQI